MTDNINNNPTGNLTAIRGGRIILPDRVVSGKVLLFDQKIVDIVDERIFTAQNRSQAVPVVDAAGGYVAPGFIDIHVHGCAGWDTMDGQLSGLVAMAENMAKSGVTGFLPTTMTMEKSKIHHALDAVRQGMVLRTSGAKILGAHMEGPFISPRYSGAHMREQILKPDIKLLADFRDVVKIITLAPEEDADFQLIKELKKKTDIVLAMGHTEADYETAIAAVQAGISHACHLFNAMKPFHHRRPGPVAAVLNSNITFELIADGVHVHPALYALLLKAAGQDKMILVTDAMRAAGLGPGTWELGGQEVLVDRDSARLADGTLAGSILTMDQAVRNILQNTGLEIYQAVALASLNPARLLQLDRSKGSLEIGKDADILIFDGQINIQMTICRGRKVFQA